MGWAYPLRSMYLLQLGSRKSGAPFVKITFLPSSNWQMADIRLRDELKGTESRV